MILPESVVKEIELRLRKIQDNPRYFSKRADVIEKSLSDLVDVHSFWIEHPEIRGKLLVQEGVVTEKELRKTVRKGVNKIRTAWNYLSSDKLKDTQVDFLGYVTPEVMKVVGRMIEPGLNSEGFRKNHVDGFRHKVPSPSLVEDYVDRFCKRIKISESHPVERAIDAHLSIAGIQPFENGNKRTARLFQKRILESFGYPPAYIPYGERAIYLDLLQDALVGVQNHDTNLQKPFYNYVAGKVASVMDDIIDDLHIK